ncbi:MAG: NAD(+) diphosphatase [Myxococcota bacterium]
MRPNWLENSPLDRLATLRLDADEVEALWRDESSRVLPLVGGKHVMDGEGPRSYAPSEVDPDEVQDRILLGRWDGRAWFGCRLPESGFPGESLQDLRFVGPRQPAPMASLLALAKALSHWHEKHRFCGACGTGTESADGGYRRRCPRCRSDEHPRVDPAIIVLVHNGDRCLLARSPRFPPRMLSTLAGFAEPAESLEDCVAREVKEEVGLEVDEICYGSSQPWPFPQSLMIGFWASTRQEALSLDEKEIEEARWVEREALRAPERLEDFTIPPRFAIARRLIQTWVDEAIP